MFGTFVFVEDLEKLSRFHPFHFKIWLINSIWVRIKATLCNPVSTAVLAPRQKRAPLISIPTKFFIGISSARPTEYSPYHNPTQNYRVIILKKSEFHFLLKEINHLLLLLLLVENIGKCFVFLEPFNLFLLPTIFQIFCKN
jgi:hypothetical protein